MGWRQPDARHWTAPARHPCVLVTRFTRVAWSADLHEWFSVTRAWPLPQRLAAPIGGIGTGLAVQAAHPWTPSPPRSTLVSGAPGSLVGDVRDLRTRRQDSR